MIFIINHFSKIFQRKNIFTSHQELILEKEFSKNAQLNEKNLSKL